MPDAATTEQGPAASNTHPAAAGVVVKMEVDALDSSTRCSDANMFERNGDGEIVLVTAGSCCGAFGGLGVSGHLQVLHNTDDYFA